MVSISCFQAGHMEMLAKTVIKGVIFLHENDFLFSQLTNRTLKNRIGGLKPSILLSLSITLLDANYKEITKMGLLFS
jgi:hypothetical protein